MAPISKFRIRVDDYIYCVIDNLRKETTTLPSNIAVLGRRRMPRAEIRVRNEQHSLLAVMSELSTVRCDRALGLWIAGTRASSVDGELPWRSSGRAAAVASTSGSRAQAATEDGFLGLRHKTKEADGG